MMSPGAGFVGNQEAYISFVPIIVFTNSGMLQKLQVTLGDISATGTKQFSFNQTTM